MALELVSGAFGELAFGVHIMVGQPHIYFPRPTSHIGVHDHKKSLLSSLLAAATKGTVYCSNIEPLYSVRMLLLEVFLSFFLICMAKVRATATATSSQAIRGPIAGNRDEYADATFSNLKTLTKAEWLNLLDSDPYKRPFPRFASASTVAKLFDKVRHPQKSFRAHQGRDGRQGFVSSTNLGRDWVLAESKQVAMDTTPQHVLEAYLSGKLQTKWNSDSVLSCQFTPNYDDETPHYRQDLVLKSQRVIRRQTGIMRYSQRIVLDRIGTDESNAAYCAYVTLDKTQPSSDTTLSPFAALHVYVQLEPQGRDTNIYAAGLFRVNRQVIPHLIIFDAAGIAGTMAGKGTLWLAAQFRKRCKA